MKNTGVILLICLSSLDLKIDKFSANFLMGLYSVDHNMCIEFNCILTCTLVRSSFHLLESSILNDLQALEYMNNIDEQYRKCGMMIALNIVILLSK